LIDNLANELDAILANADGDLINDTKNKDKKKRNKMRRSIISMDYLEDLSLVDDDNDDKKLLWKSTPDSTDINNTYTTDTIDHVQTNNTNCYEVSNNNDNINDENKEILENVTDVSCPLESNENTDVDVITAVDMTDSIGNNTGDDFTHEVIVPNDDHDEIVVPVEEYIEHSAVLTSTDILVTNSDSIDTTIGEIIITTTNTIDLYDSCITIGNDISNNEDDHNNAENVDFVNVHSHDENNFETDNNTTDNKTLVENNDIASIDDHDITSIDDHDIASIDGSDIASIDDNDIASIDGNEIASTDDITDYITNTEEYHSNEECKEVIHDETIETIETIETKAFMRLNIRFEQARWKYQWELVSYYAALQARKNKQPK